MADKSYVVRFKTEGGKELNVEIVGFGQNAEKSFRQIDTSVGKSSQMISRFGDLVSAKLVAAISAPALLYGLKNIVQGLGDLNDVATQLGQSTDKVQEFRYMAVSLGEAASVGDGALSNFTQRVGEAQQGMGKFLPLLKDYGIALTDSSGRNRDVNAIMRDYIEVISRTTDAQTQLVLAQKAFGEEEGKKFIEILRGGTAALDSYAAAAHATGNVISEDIIKKADEFDAALKTIAYTIENNFKADVVGAFQDLNTGFDDLLERAGMLVEILKHVTIGSDEQYNGLLAYALRRKGGGEMTSEDDSLFSEDGLVSQGDLTAPPKKTSAGGRKAGQDLKEFLSNLELRNKLMREGAENQELYNALKTAGVSLESKEGQLIKQKIEQFNALKQAQDENKTAAKDLGLAFKSAFEDAIVEGKSFSDVLQGLSQDIIRVLTRRVITEPLTSAVSGMVDDFDFSKVFSFLHHDGGVAGYGTSGRYVDPSIFSGAPRYHGGGIAGLQPNEVPAILKRGERVLTEEEQRYGGGSPVIKMTLINSTGVAMEEPTARNTGDGLEVSLKRAMKSAMAAGAFDREMSGRYAIKPAVG